MQIVEKKVTELKAYEKNPRKNDNAVGPVADVFKELKEVINAERR